MVSCASIHGVIMSIKSQRKQYTFVVSELIIIMLLKGSVQFTSLSSSVQGGKR